MSDDRAGARGPRTSYLVARLDRLIRSRLAEALKPFDLSVTQYTVLSVLQNRPGLSNAQLARRSYITAQAMHQMVNGLEERGLITREVSPNHGRVQMTELTAEGRALLEHCDHVVNEIEQDIFGLLGNGQESRLRDLLQALISHPPGDD
ncbi:MAG: MarR family transcriptional regulator [Acidimicrobiia bacterium]|jgi:DNA-binding MarR family transcriptional regulator